MFGNTVLKFSRRVSVLPSRGLRAVVDSPTFLSNNSWHAIASKLDPKQVESYHSEQLIRVDENDTPLGPISKGESHAIISIKRNIYHRALSLLIFDEQDRFLLTQRSDSKITFPGYYTNACCSHPLYNEQELEDDGQAIGVKRAVIRRTNFELGTPIEQMPIEELKLMHRIAYRAESDGGEWGEAEIDYIFVIKRRLSIQANPDEVKNFRYVTKSEMKHLLMHHQSMGLKITPWFKLLARDFLFTYWDNLDRLNKAASPDDIVKYEKVIQADA